MTTDLDYARRCRDAVRPAECTRAPECWADRGGSERIASDGNHGAPRCGACGGKVGNRDDGRHRLLADVRRGG